MALSRRSEPEHSRSRAKTFFNVSPGCTGLCAAPIASLCRDRRPDARGNAPRGGDARYYDSAWHYALHRVSDTHRRAPHDTCLLGRHRNP
jgi:hypothetical protein